MSLVLTVTLSTLLPCRSAKSASLASKVAEQFGAAGSGMSLRHMSTAGSHTEAAESSGPPARVPPRVHRPVVRESDMRKFAGQVGSRHNKEARQMAAVVLHHSSIRPHHYSD